MKRVRPGSQPTVEIVVRRWVIPTSGSLRAAARTWPLAARDWGAEEAAQEFLHFLVGVAARRRARFFRGADVDHGRADRVDQVGEVGQSGDQGRLDRRRGLCGWKGNRTSAGEERREQGLAAKGVHRSSQRMSRKAGMSQC